MAQATISVIIEGTTYPATYELKRGRGTVRTDIGTRSAPLAIRWGGRELRERGAVE